MSFTYAEPLNS
jgi:hypothetical protein